MSPDVFGEFEGQEKLWFSVWSLWDYTRGIPLFSHFCHLRIFHPSSHSLSLCLRILSMTKCFLHHERSDLEYILLLSNYICLTFIKSWTISIYKILPTSHPSSFIIHVLFLFIELITTWHYIICLFVYSYIICLYSTKY